jgi:pimeloyl-ACP methyl ester carboxylesterase
MNSPIDASTVALHHRDLGGQGEPPMVHLHGMLGSSRNWQTVGKALASARRVYALDLRNHGLSPHADTMSYASMAADVLAWMDSHGIGVAEVVGHSMGGKVAMLMACRNGPRVSRLVVVDTAPRDYRWPERAGEFAAMNGLELKGLHSRGEAESRFEPNVPDWSMRKFLSTNLERTPGGGWKWLINLPAITAALPELESNPLSAEDRYEGPSLFIAGGKSRYIRADDTALITGHFPKARVVTLPESGHNPHIEVRDEFVSAVLADA